MYVVPMYVCMPACIHACMYVCMSVCTVVHYIGNLASRVGQRLEAVLGMDSHSRVGLAC